MARTAALAIAVCLLVLSSGSAQTTQRDDGQRPSVDQASLQPVAHNDAGQVVGNAPSPGTVVGYRAYVWSAADGLRVLADDAVATDINNGGEIVGFRFVCGPEPDRRECAASGFLWSEGAGFRDLGDFWPTSVDDNGDMAGTCVDQADGRIASCTVQDGVVAVVPCTAGAEACGEAPPVQARRRAAAAVTAGTAARAASGSALQATAVPSAQAVTAAAANPVQLENAKAGTTEWKLTNRGYATGAIEGYASEASVNRGGQIKLYVSTAAPSFTMDIFRMGYYGGSGARRMLPTITLTGRKQTVPAPDALGMVECNWTNPYVLDIPNSTDPTDWMSGIYLVKLTESVGKKQQYIVFAVRHDARASALLFMQAVNTYHAYNVWGGKSLYGTIADSDDKPNRARRVSFNRPYFGQQGDGVGQFFSWELAKLQFLEKEGYDVTYATNVDVDRDPNLLLSHKAFLSIGHDEYWSWRMRNHVEAARDKGVSLGFFSGNTSYWQVRYENSVATGQPFRTLVGYKSSWADDPITPDYLKTNQFRLAPVNRPEDAMIGVMFVTQARPFFVVEDASHWIFTGTGLKNGDVLKNADGTSFLGYEIDSMGPGSPANTQRVGHSPVAADGANFADMTVYRAASGATVFSTGSIGWSVDVPQAQQIMRNVLARLIDNAFADTTPVRPALPAPFTSGDIGNTGRAGFVALASSNAFTLNGAGQNSTSSTTDALFFARRTLSGNGQIVVKVTGLQRYYGNRAGIMIRESLSPGSNYASVVVRGAGSSTPPEGADFRIRDAAGTKPRTLVSRDFRMPNWIKLVRSGNTFTSSTSADGVTWTVLGTATIPMATNVYIGTSVASSRYGVWATARFENVSVTGGTGGEPPPPPPPPPPGDAPTIVIRAKDVTQVTGKWTKVNDATAAEGIALHNPDASVPKISTAAATPANYFEATFTAPAGVAYHMWIRMKAQNNYFGNDSIHVQLSDSRDAAGAAIYRIGTSSSAVVVQQESDNGPIAGWGWADQGWNGNGIHVYFAAPGTHTIRIQQREDGVMIDQIVLSPSTYLSKPPGSQSNDTTFVPR